MEIDIIEKFELNKCVEWIIENKYSKVCLQFPDSLLKYSFDVALYIEQATSNKCFVLADTSYGSCCVDEVAANHVDGDAIIHFGHACLSRNNNIHVLHVLEKKNFCLEKLSKAVECLKEKKLLILYDTGYNYLRHEFKNIFSGQTVSEIIINLASEPCNNNCLLPDKTHEIERMSRGFCNSNFEAVIYIGSDPSMENFLLAMKNVEFYNYTENGLNLLDSFKMYKKMSFLIEKIKDAETIGLLVGTLSVANYLKGIEHVKKLCKRWNKKFYIISVGKPTVAKISNFPEIDIFVAISCPESNFIDNKTCIQPIVGLLEIELALNENRSYDNSFSRDFRDLIEGGLDFVKLPEHPPEHKAEPSLVSSKMRGTLDFPLQSKELALNPEKGLTTNDFFSKRTWDGLELTKDEAPTILQKGRAGTAQGYSEEISSMAT